MNDGWKFAPLEATDQMAGGGMRASNVWWIRDSRTKERAGIFLSFFFTIHQGPADREKKVVSAAELSGSI